MMSLDDLKSKKLLDFSFIFKNVMPRTKAWWVETRANMKLILVARKGKNLYSLP